MAHLKVLSIAVMCAAQATMAQTDLAEALEDVQAFGFNTVWISEAEESESEAVLSDYTGNNNIRYFEDVKGERRCARRCQNRSAVGVYGTTNFPNACLCNLNEECVERSILYSGGLVFSVLPENEVTPCPEAETGITIAESESFYGYSWAASEGWHLAPSQPQGGRGTWEIYNEIDTIQTCQGLCEDVNAQAGMYDDGDSTCICQLNAECIEPTVSLESGTIFAKNPKPEICEKSYCDIFPENAAVCGPVSDGETVTVVTLAPTASPTKSPSGTPTKLTRLSPTDFNASIISSSPSISSSTSRTVATTEAPTANPTGSPTATPTATPTAMPTPSSTTTLPTISPTAGPTDMPTSDGTPTKLTLFSPTDFNASIVSSSPSISSSMPTAGPTDTPTSDPSMSPTEMLLDVPVLPFALQMLFTVPYNTDFDLSLSRKEARKLWGYLKSFISTQLEKNQLSESVTLELESEGSNVESNPDFVCRDESPIPFHTCVVVYRYLTGTATFGGVDEELVALVDERRINGAVVAAFGAAAPMSFPDYVVLEEAKQDKQNEILSYATSLTFKALHISTGQTSRPTTEIQADSTTAMDSPPGMSRRTMLLIVVITGLILGGFIGCGLILCARWKCEKHAAELKKARSRTVDIGGEYHPDDYDRNGEDSNSTNSSLSSDHGRSDDRASRQQEGHSVDILDFAAPIKPQMPPTRELICQKDEEEDANFPPSPTSVANFTSWAQAGHFDTNISENNETVPKRGAASAKNGQINFGGQTFLVVDDTDPRSPTYISPALSRSYDDNDVEAVLVTTSTSSSGDGYGSTGTESTADLYDPEDLWQRLEDISNDDDDDGPEQLRQNVNSSDGKESRDDQDCRRDGGLSGSCSSSEEEEEQQQEDDNNIDKELQGCLEELSAFERQNELMPAPTDERLFYVSQQKRGLPFANSTDESSSGDEGFKATENLSCSSSEEDVSTMYHAGYRRQWDDRRYE
jgi:hypothetical protein